MSLRQQRNTCLAALPGLADLESAEMLQMKMTYLAQEGLRVWALCEAVYQQHSISMISFWHSKSHATPPVTALKLPFVISTHKQDSFKSLQI